MRTHPLSETLATLNRESGFERLTLRGLTQAECAGYIRDAANVEPSLPVLARIFEETEGNPFFLSEVVNLMTQEGTIEATSLSDITIPDGVREALGRRLDRISEEGNALLQVAAVVGREFPYDALAVLSEADDEGTLRLVEEAIDARVIEELDRPGRYRFTHHLMQETLLTELSTTRRIRLHGQIGAALEDHYGDRADQRASQLAQHFVESATLAQVNTTKAIRYSDLAAAQAEAQMAWSQAATHYEDCLALLATSAEAETAEEARILERLGVCYLPSILDRANSWESLQRAIDLYGETKNWDGMARATVTAASRTLFLSDDQILPLINHALAQSDTLGPRLEAHLLVLRAVRTDDLAQGQRDADRANELATPRDVPVLAELRVRDARLRRSRGRSRMPPASFGKRSRCAGRRVGSPMRCGT